MFKLTVNNTEYKVSFHHDLDYMETTCTIQNLNNTDQYFTGHAFVSKTDHNYDKGIGRFISLLRATVYFDRDIRIMFFDKYKSMSKIPHINFKVKETL